MPTRLLPARLVKARHRARNWPCPVVVGVVAGFLVVEGAGWVVSELAVPSRVEAGAARSWPGLTWAVALVVGGAARSLVGSAGKSPVSQAVRTAPITSRAATPRSRRPARRDGGGAGGRTGRVGRWAGADSVRGACAGAWFGSAAEVGADRCGRPADGATAAGAGVAGD